MGKVICLGELLIDMVCPEKDVGLGKGRQFTRAPGGAPANVAVAVSRLGHQVGFIGKVGNDPFGISLINLLNEENIDTKYLEKIDDIRTTVVFVGIRKDQKKEMVFYRNPGADMLISKTQIKTDYFKKASVFHCGSISLIDPVSREATEQGIRVAKNLGLIVTYDPNYRPTLWEKTRNPANRMRSVLPNVDVVKVSEEEWEIFSGEKDFVKGCRKIEALGPKLIVISMGESGCFYYTRTIQGTVKGFKVNVVETTGAGDAFVGAIISWLVDNSIQPSQLDSLSESQLVEMLTFANAAGALATLKLGAIPALPTQEEVIRFLKK